MSESVTRDQQASGYLLHAKHRVHIDRIRRFLSRTKPHSGSVLDLGCGPGPTVKILADAGFTVTGVDFSPASLEINKASCAGLNPPPNFVHADLRTWAPEPFSADGLMMSDFLQHIGDMTARRAALERYFTALRPGGWFYLSTMNYNAKNWLRGDRAGVWPGSIPYWRTTPGEVVSLLPNGLRTYRVDVCSISHAPRLDRMLCALPGARAAARWVILTGTKGK